MAGPHTTTTAVPTRLPARSPVRQAQPISLPALCLHAQALLASFEAGHPGFIPDRYLFDGGPDTAPAVLELCLAGVWARRERGYQVVCSEALRMATEVHRHTPRTSD